MPSPTAPNAPQPSPVAAAAAVAARAAFKGLSDWIEVFKAGEQTDSKGRKRTYTAEHLDQIVANVAGSGVPHVIGHPKETDPAYAWTKPGQVKREGDSLFVQCSDVNPAFEAGVDQGAYRERSVALYEDPQKGWTMLHVGWLGAQAPAIAGLQPLQYSAPQLAEDQVFRFDSGLQTAWALGDVTTALRNLRDWLIADKGMETADRVLPDWLVTSVGNSAQQIRADELQEVMSVGPMGYAQGNPAGGAATHTTTIEDRTMPTPTATAAIPGAAGASGGAAVHFSAADIERVRAEAAAAATAAATAQFAAQGAELAELRAQRQSERIGTQINGWKAAGQLLPAEEPGLAEFMAALEGGSGSASGAATFTFSRADKTEAVQTPAEWFAAFMAGRKALVKLGAKSDAEANAADPNAVDTSDYRAIHDAAQVYIREQAASGRSVGIDAAVAHVVRTAASLKP